LFASLTLANEQAGSLRSEQETFFVGFSIQKP
jgi:hypothetical protein